MEKRVEELTEYLSRFVTPRRLARMEEVLRERTRYITVLLEDIYQPHNASAVLRSCDSCGVQDVHILEKRNSYRVNPGVELGTAQWLTLRKYRLPRPGESGAPVASPSAEGRDSSTLVAEDPTALALRQLRDSGYRIVATTPHTDEVDLPEFDLFRGKVALCFGTEMGGLSEGLLAEADEYLRIPMYGFVESFNISVSAAITLYTLTQRLRSPGREFPSLDSREIEELRLSWLRGSVKEWRRLEQRFVEESGAGGGE
ncbi:MAG: TrmH family RNA methyltransferase [Spirochaetaceae bacterium]